MNLEDIEFDMDLEYRHNTAVKAYHYSRGIICALKATHLLRDKELQVLRDKNVELYETYISSDNDE